MKDEDAATSTAVEDIKEEGDATMNVHVVENTNHGSLGSGNHSSVGDGVPIEDLLQQQRDVQLLYTTCLSVLCSMASQCIATDDELQFSKSLQNHIVQKITELFPSPDSKRGINKSEEEMTNQFIFELPSNLTNNHFTLLCRINEQIQEHTKDRLCYDILLFLYSMNSWNILENGNISTSHFINLLFHLIYNNTPRVQLLALKFCSLLLPSVSPSTIEPLIGRLNDIPFPSQAISNKSSIQLHTVNDFLLLLFDLIGCSFVGMQSLCKSSDYLPIHSTVSSTTGADSHGNDDEDNLVDPTLRLQHTGKRSISSFDPSSSSNQLDSEENPNKKRKIANDKSLASGEWNENNLLNPYSEDMKFKWNTKHPLSYHLFYHRTPEERLIIVQEISSFLRSLLFEKEWKIFIQSCILNSIDNISNITFIHDPTDTTNANANANANVEEKDEILMERLIAGLCLIGGHEEIPTIRDMVYINLSNNTHLNPPLPNWNKNKSKNDDLLSSGSTLVSSDIMNNSSSSSIEEKQRGTLLDRISIFSYILESTTSQCVLRRNDNIEIQARVPYTPNLIQLSFQQLKNILHLISKFSINKSKGKVLPTPTSSEESINMNETFELLLLRILQRVISNNIYEFMKYPELIIGLISNLNNISLSMSDDSEDISLELLKSKLLALKENLLHEKQLLNKSLHTLENNEIFYQQKQQKLMNKYKLNQENHHGSATNSSGSQMDYFISALTPSTPTTPLSIYPSLDYPSRSSLPFPNHDLILPNYYFPVKKQFEKQYPFSLFHTLNLKAYSSVALSIQQLSDEYMNLDAEYLLLVPCGMKLSGGTVISHAIANSSNLLTLTAVTWSNYSIPKYPLLIHFYFEMTVLSQAPGGDVGIGLIDSQADCDHADGSQIGSVSGSFGYISRNGWVLNESPEPDEQFQLEPYGVDDTVGCLL